MSHMQPIPADVFSAFERHSPEQCQILLDARAMIFDVAHMDPRIGRLDEALRWGEPAYLTTRTKAGSTIRLGVERHSGQPALFFNCKTTLVEGFRHQFGASLTYSKNRAVLLDVDALQQGAALRICVAAALTYHLGKRQARSGVRAGFPAPHRA